MERWFPIRTARLLLREFRASDEFDVHEYASDPIVSQFDEWGPNTPEKTSERLARHLREQERWPRQEVDLAVELLSEQKIIGSTSVWMSDEKNRTAGFGYTFNQRYWNQGFATEATRALLNSCFQSFEMHRVWASCDVRNIGSWRVMEKLGMRREGMFLRDKFQKGVWRDSYLYAILADEWQSACR